MSRKSKIDPALKVQLVEQYLRDEIGVREAGRLAGLPGNGIDSFRQWVNIYRNEGPAGLLEQSRNKYYSEETKLQAVNDYLDGKGSLRAIAAQYGLRSKKQLQTWLKQYNTHGKISTRTSGGGSYMRKARQTSPEERLEIVQDCLNNGKNYGAMAGYCDMRRWALPVLKTAAGAVPAHSPPELLRKNSGIRSPNWSARIAICRWRMIC